MESIWDYVMRRKPIFLGYFALFLASVFASCQFISSITSQNTADEPNIVQETPQPEQREQYDRVLSPESVALLAAPEDHETNSNDAVVPEPTISLNFVQVSVADPADDISPADAADPAAPTEPIAEVPLTSVPQNISTSQAPAAAQNAQQTLADLSQAPATTPRKISIFRTILAVLLAVTALTLAGLGLYQAYDYLAPYIEKYLKNAR